MIYRDHQHHLIIGHRGSLQCRILYQTLDKAQIGLTVPHQRGNRFRIAHGEIHGQAGIGGTEIVNDLGQPVVANRLAGGKVERPNLQPGKIGKHEFRHHCA